MIEDDQFLMISALQHYAYCPRQFALIHIEQVWEDNFFTTQGNTLHERVDHGEPEQRGNIRYERSVAVKSEKWQLKGKLDLLEIESGQPVRYFPVEYKRGKAKSENWDKIQLCAQALCLEEMRGITISEGALWYWQTRKRERVIIGDELRSATTELTRNAHDLLHSGATPLPTKLKSRCKACSLIDLCEPSVFRQDKSQEYIKQLFASNQ